MKLFSLSTVAYRFVLITVSLTISLLLLIIFTSNIHAQECDEDILQTEPYPAKKAIDLLNKCAIEKNVFDDKIFNNNQIAGTIDSLNTLMFGTSQLHPETDVATRGSGALATTGTIVAALYATPPVSGVDYFAQKFRDINPVKPAYAAPGDGGIGFNALTPVQDLWAVFRNISYVGFVIVFVIMGFMIMFRSKISPQAVATVQDSIPRITIALILVTFSYAIAGLMIDIMFLILNIVINTLQAAGVLHGSIGQDVFQKSIFGVVIGSWKDIFSTVYRAINDVIGNVLQFPGPISWAEGLFSFLGGGIAGLIVGIAMLYIMFKVFLMLLMAYVMVIILTMAAPFFFLFQALPGMNGASSWFKQMASNIAVFPTVALMFVFAGVLGGLNGTSAITQGQVGQFPLLAGDINLPDMGKLIGVGILLMTPQAADMVKRAIGSQGQGGGAGAGIGASLAPAAGVVGGAAGRGARAGGRAAWEAMPDTGRAKYLSGGYWRQRRADKEAGERLSAEDYQQHGPAGTFTKKTTR